MRLRLLIAGLVAITVGAALSLTRPWARDGVGDPPIVLAKGMNLGPWLQFPKQVRWPDGAYIWPPFAEHQDAIGRSDLERLRRQGIDSVRILIDPGPFLAFDGPRRERLLTLVRERVDLAMAADLRVVVDLHPLPESQPYNDQNLLADLDGPLLLAYRALISDVSRLIADTSPAAVALELLNEPSIECDPAKDSRWQRALPSLIRTARRHLPEHALVVSGACWGGVDGLMRLDPASLDDNLLYSFHLYEPLPFTHQRAPWMAWARPLPALPYPSEPRPLEELLAPAIREIDADQSLSDERRETMRRDGTWMLSRFAEARWDRARMASFLDRVVAWADAHDLPRSRLMLGEFGVIRGVGLTDRTAWLRDVRELAQERRIAWFAYSYLDQFGLVEDDSARRMSPEMAAALGLTTAP